MTPLSFIPTLYVLGIVQGAFLSLSLVTSKSGNHQANRYLACLTLLFTIALVDYFADITGLTARYPMIQTLLWPKEFFYGVFVYFYVRQLTSAHPIVIQGKQWLHFLPGTVHLILSWTLLLLSSEEQSAILDQAEHLIGWQNLWRILLGDVEFLLSLLHLGCYLTLSLIKLNRHQRAVLQNFSEQESINLRWLKRLLLGVSSIYIIWLMQEAVASEEGDQWLDTLLGVSMVCLIYAMGYLGLRQPLIFSRSQQDYADPDYCSPNRATLDHTNQSIENSEPEVTPPVEPTGAGEEKAHQTATDKTVDEKTTPRSANTASATMVEDSDSKKYKNSGLTPELSRELLDSVTQTLESQKLYLDNQLSLPQLADHIGLSANLLSQCINENLNQNFFEFINSYRVRQSQRLLREQRSKSVLDIGLESGFNSKSAFYGAFKKHTGMSPGAYRSQPQ
tara:strand:+ start:24860 stop:26206 length:1347 start_codon:yes stop_codon:yes gene_type:complete